MSSFAAPLQDMQFVLNELAGLADIARLPTYGEATPDLVTAILDAAGKFAAEIIAPLNAPGDRQGAKFDNGKVTTPDGFREAYTRFVEDGWNALAVAQEHGGQGLPQMVHAPVQEIWQAANVSFALCGMLTQGAVEALILRGSEQLKAEYLPKMVSGEWTGTMNLTEPQAGSDLAAVRCRAVRENDHYRITGQKIFITYGEHDWTDNIIHLVLARTPDAPEGVKGISMFLVPKLLSDQDGKPGKQNDVHCASIEHKLGIHASPTAVISYGEGEGAIGYLIGEENHGLEYMFIMMNLARFAVGMQGIGIAERAWQQALSYARQRVQGSDASERGGKPVAITRHPDVRRMLMSMKSRVEAMRAVAYVTAARMDVAMRHEDQEVRTGAQAFADLMIPVVKGWCTENAIDIASLGIQVHGGMGYIEETGAAQYLRDARISTIYEGTTGIQARDLVGRKIARDKGMAVQALITEMRELDKTLAETDGEDFRVIRARLTTAVDALAGCVDWLLKNYTVNINAVLAGSVPFLMLLGTVTGGWQMARAALAAGKKLAAGNGDPSFYRAKISTARYYADYELTRAPGIRDSIIAGATGVLALSESQFG